jgi:DNA primase
MAIEEVRTRVDIAEVIGTHVPLKRAGRNLKGICPFHNEKSPSFTVSQEKQLYHCFGCGAGGSVFDFVMKVRNYSFAEALEYLASRAGIVIEAQSGRDRAEVEAEENEKKELFVINDIAMQFFQHCLNDPKVGEEARAYLAERGIDDITMRQFKLGYAPEGWDFLTKHLMRKGVLMKQAVHLGLVAPRERHPDHGTDFYDRLRNRIIFPIFDTKGRVIGFGGRLLKSTGAPTEGGKYINSPQSTLFDKGKTFYLLDRAEETIRRGRQAIVVEGYLDAIAMHRAGLTNAVATLGTALTPYHGKLMSRYADTVIALFDGDEAGIRAAVRAMGPIYQSGLDARIVLLPGDHDPDSYLAEHGPAALAREVAAGTSLLEFCTDLAMRAGVSNREKAAGLQEIIRTLNLVPNGLQRELWLQEFARITSLNPETIQKIRAHESAITNRNQSPSGLNSLHPGQARAVGTTVPPQNQAVSTVSQEPRGEEEMLVCLAFESQAVYEMLRSYEGPVLIQHPVLRDLLLEQFARGRKSGAELLYVLESIQDEGLRRRLQSTMFAVEKIEAAVHVQAARDCIRKVLMRNFEMRKRDLSEKIKEAMLKQDQQMVNDLMKQKNLLLSKQGL